MQIYSKVLGEAHCVVSNQHYRLNGVACGGEVWYTVSINDVVAKEFNNEAKARAWFEELSYRAND